MFIQTQATPNPTSLMFIPGQKVMEAGSKSFGSAREAMASPLAKKLFAIDGVTQVGGGWAETVQDSQKRCAYYASAWDGVTGRRWSAPWAEQAVVLPTLLAPSLGRSHLPVHDWRALCPLSISHQS
jgi:hypothetical protein